jgi:hypothetical protein
MTKYIEAKHIVTNKIVSRDLIVLDSFINNITVGQSITISGPLQTDTITEQTSDNGVQIEGVLLKDSELIVDTISEQTFNNGVQIEGVILKDSELLVDTISEQTTDNGVQIEGVTLKDSDAIVTGALSVGSFSTIPVDIGSVSGDLGSVINNSFMLGDIVYIRIRANVNEVQSNNFTLGSITTVDAHPDNTITIPGSPIISGVEFVPTQIRIFSDGTIRIDFPNITISAFPAIFSGMYRITWT